MNESPDTTGCDGVATGRDGSVIRPIIATIGEPVPAGRPVIRMHPASRVQNVRFQSEAKGKLTAAFAAGDTENWVELWFQSPTGDQSDSVIFHLPCTSYAQAVEIAAYHREVWGIPAFD